MDHMTPLQKAIDLLGNQTKVAEAIGISPQAVSEIVRKNREVPAAWCPKIEKATGGQVTMHDLRPDLFEPQSAAA